MDPGTAIAVATLSTKVVSLIWKYSSDFKNAQSSITLLANEIEAFKQVMLKLEELLKKSSNLPALGSLETTLKQALLDVENLERKLRPGKGAKTMERLGKRLKWPLDKKEVEDWITTFQRLKATVNLALNTDTTYGCHAPW